MARTNKSKPALLALLSLGPKTGYDIQRDIRRTIGHFWSESYGQIYPALRLIVEEGLATVERQPQDGKPDRKVYAITQQGHAALQAWLHAAPEPPPVRNEMLLKLFVGWQAAPDALMSHLTGLKEHFSSQLVQFGDFERFLKREMRNNPDAMYWLMTVRSGHLYVQARLQWCEEAMSLLKKSMKATKEKKLGTPARTKRMSSLMALAHEVLNPDSLPKQK